MKRIKLLIVIFLVSQIAFSQENTSIVFPDSYFGIYTGKLVINTSKGVKNYPMEFHLLETDSIGIYNYTLVYGEGEDRQERKYTLKEKDASKGIYSLDENNGILLDCKVLNNKLYFLFKVKDSLLTTFVTFYKDYLIFEIIVTNVDEKKTSGGQNEEIPEVTSYPISVVQKAVLNKQ